MMKKPFRFLDITAYLFAGIIVLLAFYGMWSMGKNVQTTSLLVESDKRTISSIDLDTLHSDKAVWLAVNDDGLIQFETKPDESKFKNIIRIENNTVHMESADCRDQLCVKTKAINKPGQTIVCLPNKIVVRMTGNGDDEVDDISH